MNIYTVKVTNKINKDEKLKVLLTIDDIIADDENTAKLKVAASEQFKGLEVDVEEVTFHVRSF